MEKVWSDWIEWKGGECPIPDAKAGEWQAKSVRGLDGCSQEHCDYYTKTYSAAGNSLGIWRHEPGYWPVVAYRVKLTDRLEPTPEEVEATQLPETPEADEAADMREMNAAMLARDEAGSYTPRQEVVVWEDTSRQDAIDYAADCAKVENLMRVSRRTHRFGGWNAEV